MKRRQLILCGPISTLFLRDDFWIGCMHGPKPSFVHCFLVFLKENPCLVSLQFLSQEATFILSLALLAVVTCHLAFQDSTTEFPCVNFVRHITRPPASWIGNSQLNSLNLCLATLLLPRSKTHAILPSKRFEETTLEVFTSLRYPRPARTTSTNPRDYT